MCALPFVIIPHPSHSSNGSVLALAVRYARIPSSRCILGGMGLTSFDQPHPFLPIFRSFFLLACSRFLEFPFGKGVFFAEPTISNTCRLPLDKLT